MKVKKNTQLYIALSVVIGLFAVLCVLLAVILVNSQNEPADTSGGTSQTFAEYTSELLNQSATESDTPEQSINIYFVFFLDFLITAAAYLLVPLIFCARGASGKKLSQKQVKTIVIVNGAIVWLIFMIIRIELDIEGTSYAVFLWSSIAYFMMKKACMRSASTINTNKSQNQNSSRQPHISLSPLDEQPTKQAGLTYGNDIRLVKSENKENPTPNKNWVHLSDNEIAVLLAYRSNSEMQIVIDRLLGVENNTKD